MNLLYTDFEYYANVSEMDGFQHYPRSGNYTFIANCRDANKYRDITQRRRKCIRPVSSPGNTNVLFFL